MTRGRIGKRQAQRAVLAALLAVALAIQPWPFLGGGPAAFALTATSHAIAKNVGQISQYVNGAYDHDFTEGVLGVNGEVAFCMDPNITFKPGQVTSADILTAVSQDQLADIALRAHFMRSVYQDAYLSDNARVLIAQTLVWEVLVPSQAFVVVPAESGGSLAEVTGAIRDDAMAKARAFSAENRQRYRGYGTLWLNGSTQPVATFGCELVVGAIDVLKRSSEPEATEGNGCYTLEGAVFGVFSDAGCTSRACTLETDAAGYAKSGELHVGTYYVREEKAPAGYLVDGTVREVAVRAGQTARVGGGEVRDVPASVPALARIVKHDAESDWDAALNEALGAGSLAGAVYAVAHYGGTFATPEEAEASGAPLRTWEFETDAAGAIDFTRAEEHLVSGTLYRNAAGDVVFPLGTYVVREAQPSHGYLLSEDAHAVKVEQAEGGCAMSGDVVSAEAGEAVVDAEQVMRSDLALVKVREADLARLAGVPFALTSETTGESHLLVTDENGRIDTSAGWNAHTSKTNGNDAARGEDGRVDEGRLDADAGVWFGQRADGSTTEPDDALGALPFDTYALEELPCSANEGLSLVKIGGIVVKRDGVVVDLGTVDDRSDQVPYLSTSAFDAYDLDKWAVADKTTRIVDHVEYMNLVPNESYTIRATLFDPAAGRELEGVESSVDFVAQSANGSVEVTIEADLAGSDVGRLVVFEELLCGSDVVAEHKDGSDASQTVNIGAPNVTTYARDAHDGDKSVSAERRAVVTDEVELVNLVPGRSYRLFGTVVEAESGLPVLSQAASGLPADDVEADTPAGDAQADASAGQAAGQAPQEPAAPSEQAPLPDQAQVRAFWEGLLQLLGATAREEGGFEVAQGTPFDAEAVRGYLEENASVSSRMVLASMEVQADAARTVASLDYEMDATGMEGGYVIYDLLTSEGEVMATHADPANEMESFEVEQPALSTEATDAADGDHVVLPSMETKVVDTVSYEGLLEGREYVMSGLLVNKADGSVLYADGEAVCAEKAFTANASSGTVQVEFAFDALGLEEGAELVAYEFLTKDGEDVAEHADVDDEAQTVVVGSVPEGKGYYKTGGGNGASAPVLVGAGAAVGAGLYVARRKVSGVRAA